jgi:hypothetical protein
VLADWPARKGVLKGREMGDTPMPPAERLRLSALSFGTVKGVRVLTGMVAEERLVFLLPLLFIAD